jgi:hypothetical protein
LSISETPANHLNRLVGNDLSSVEFVRDYFQLRFNGPTLNVTTKATLVNERGTSTFPEATFITETVGLIGSHVVNTSEDASAVTIQFDRGRLAMSLNPNDFDVEALYFFDDLDRFAAVWN